MHKMRQVRGGDQIRGALDPLIAKHAEAYTKNNLDLSNAQNALGAWGGPNKRGLKAICFKACMKNNLKVCIDFQVHLQYNYLETRKEYHGMKCIVPGV